MAIDTVTTVFDMKVKGDKELKTVTKTVKRLDEATGHLVQTRKKHNQETGKLMASQERIVKRIKQEAKAKVQLSKATDRATRSQKRYNKQGSRFLKTGKLMGDTTSALRYKLIQLATAGSLAAAGGFMYKIVDSLKDAQHAMFNLQTTFFDDKFGRGPEKTMIALRREAERTGVSFVKLSDNVSNLRRRGFDETQAMDFTALGEDISAISSDPRTSALVANALGQIKAKGRLQTEELNQLSEGGGLNRDWLMEEIGKGRGMDTSDKSIFMPKMLKQLQSGLIGSDEALQAMKRTYMRIFNMGRSEDNMLTRPGQFAKEYGKTLPGSLNRLKAVAQNTFDQLAKVAGPKIASGVSKLIDYIKDFRQDPERMASFENFIDRISAEFSDLYSKTLPAASDALAEFFKGLFGEGENSDKTFAEILADSLRDGKDDFREMGKSAGTMISDIKEMVQAIDDSVVLKALVGLIKGTEVAVSSVAHPLGNKEEKRNQWRAILGDDLGNFVADTLNFTGGNDKPSHKTSDELNKKRDLGTIPGGAATTYRTVPGGNTVNMGGVSVNMSGGGEGGVSREEFMSTWDEAGNQSYNEMQSAAQSSGG